MCLSDNDENIALAVLDKETILFLAEAAEPGDARPSYCPQSGSGHLPRSLLTSVL